MCQRSITYIHSVSGVDVAGVKVLLLYCITS